MITALPHCCFVLTALGLAQSVLLLLPGRDGVRWFLAGGQLVLALGFLICGWLTTSRRLPAWRREPVLAGLLLVGVLLATIRAAVLQQPWQLAELPVLGTAAAALISAPTWVLAVVAAGPVGWLGGFAASVAGGGTGTQFGLRWAGAGVVTAAGAAVAFLLQRIRAAWSEALSSAKSVATESSVRDSLTGAANRRGLEMVAQPMLEHARRDGQAVHCLVVDVDGLRQVNEQAGSRGGDDVLLCLAAALRESSRTTDVVARWGEDQFVLIGPGTGTSPLELERRIRSRVKASPPVPVQVWNGRVSVGSATLVPWDEGDLGSLLGRAESDMALRRSLRRKADTARQGAAAIPAAPAAQTGREAEGSSLAE